MCASVADDDPTLPDVWRELRGLRAGETHQLFAYIAGMPAQHQHTVQPAGWTDYRTLLRGEAWWWALGMADAEGVGRGMMRAASGAMPELMSIEDAAATIPNVDRWGIERAPAMTVDGVQHNINRGVLYPVYGKQRARFLFADQVRVEVALRRMWTLQAQNTPPTLAKARKHQDQVDAAVIAHAEAAKVWGRLRAKLPPIVRPEDISVDLSPGPDLHPLSLTGRVPLILRAALKVAHQQRWLQFLHFAADNSAGVRIHDATRTIPGDGVLPYVLGVADRHGLGELVVYRPGLRSALT